MARRQAWTPDPKEYQVGQQRVKSGFYFLEGADYVLNRADLHDTISVPDMGCCGQAGHKVNVLCANGHPVATEHSDCWCAHDVVLHDELARSVPQSDE